MVGASALLACCVVSGTEFPEAQITNKAITAKFYLPNAERGYYRGTRFDWSGVIYSLRANGHEYFGQWFEKYDPKLHDAIQGPVEEFLTDGAGLGYAEAKPGESFIRIGVGIVRKTDDKPYERFRTYEILDPGRWTIRPENDRVVFIHELSDDAGYAYRYTKTVRLVGSKPEMIIEHALRNTGKKPIATQQYNHNFFVMDGQPTGPEASAQFPFTLKADKPVNPELASVEGGKISYKRELEKGQSVFAEFTGYSGSASEFDVKVENKKAGTGVRIVGDRPIAKLYYWSIRTTLCPEVYIDLQVDPGKETKWKYTYTFYELK
ncbi:MAG: hypothetical protein H7Y20_03415 [Bryobacteraceae bacterium]|nr:hypothetical protein [Bryobacteraceae bacterium]